MKKGLLTTVLLTGLLLLGACNKGGGGGGGSDDNLKSLSITNKTELTAEWHVGDASRTISITSDPVINTKQAIASGELVVTSDAPKIVSTSGLDISAVAAGSSTVSVAYKGKTWDSFTVEVLPKRELVVVTNPQAGREYFLGESCSTGDMRYAKAAMNGYYIDTSTTLDEADVATVEIDTTAKDEYKYKISLGTGENKKTISSYKDASHCNIGFVGDKDTFKAPALFKLNDDFSLSTMITLDGTTTVSEYFMGTYSTYTTVSYRDASQIEFKARLFEYGVMPEVTSITLNKTELNIEVPQTETLTATILPTAAFQTITWATDNEAVATVSKNGVVTAVDQGVAHITATAGGKTATCTVTVTKGEELNYGTLEKPLTITEAKALLDKIGGALTPEHMFVTGVVSSSTAESSGRRNIWLKDGDTEQAFEFYSTYIDESITGVGKEEDALVGYTVIGTGYAKIYSGTYELTSVKNDDGSYDNPVVKVATPGEVPELKGIVLDTNALSMKPEETHTLVVSPTPSRAVLGRVTFESEDDTVATVGEETGVVTAVATGSTTITARCGEFTATCSVAVLPDVETKTVSVNITDWCVANGKVKADQVLLLQEDGIKAEVTAGTANKGKMYVSDAGVWEWRFYKSGSDTLEISLDNGGKVVSITVGLAKSNFGEPVDTMLELTGEKAIINAGADGLNSNFNIKYISITYIPAK